LVQAEKVVVVVRRFDPRQALVLLSAVGSPHPFLAFLPYKVDVHTGRERLRGLEHPTHPRDLRRIGLKIRPDRVDVEGMLGGAILERGVGDAIDDAGLRPYPG
jgi:hypothetical protein